jgi:hypothetical protein
MRLIANVRVRVHVYDDLSFNIPELE